MTTPKNMPPDRPKLYPTLELLEEAVEAYFQKCDDKDEPYTMTGLARTLGMSRQTLSRYSKLDPYCDTIKAARQQVEESIERGLMRGYNATGAIFNLKNNFGWRDEKQIDNTSSDGSMTPTVIERVIVKADEASDKNG